MFMFFCFFSTQSLESGLVLIGGGFVYFIICFLCSNLSLLMYKILDQIQSQVMMDKNKDQLYATLTTNKCVTLPFLSFSHRSVQQKRVNELGCKTSIISSVISELRPTDMR